MMFSFKLSTALVATVTTLVFAQSSTVPVTGLLGNATTVTGNPIAAAYIATFPNSNTTAIRGSVVASSPPSGTGVSFQISLSGFPSLGGPFLYHIHNDPVPADGNCTATGSHLDPFQRGETPVCDSLLPNTCQVGDLAGKYGSIPGAAFSASYIDDYVSTIVGSSAFVGNRSIVIHYANKTRITCASFNSLDAGYTAVNTTTSGNATSANATATSNTTASGLGLATLTTATYSTSARSSSTSSTTAKPASSTGGAAGLVVNAAAVFMGCLAFLV